MSVPVPVSESGQVPVFPLPSVVFFPKTVLPLHVFEPRYRALIRDALAGEKLVAVSLLKPGWEADYNGSPAFHDVGTVGRIEDLERLSDGRFNLRLVGLQRVRFGELVRERPYRLVRVTPLAESLVDERAPEIVDAKLDVLASHGVLVKHLMESRGQDPILDERMPFETAINGACANLPVDPARRQDLLEEDDLLLRHRRVSALLEAVLKQVLRLKSKESAEGDLLN